MKLKTKIIIGIVVALLIGATSFFLGRSTIDAEIEYRDGEVVHDTIYSEQLVIDTVVIPEEPDLPTKPDTVKLPGEKIIIIQIVDTAKIIANYIEKRKYNNRLFDNENGKLDISADVQYNELKQLRYTFVPKLKEVTKLKLITPFISTSYNSFGYVELGGGIFIKDIGIEGKYVTDLKNKGFEIGMKYKF